MRIAGEEDVSESQREDLWPPPQNTSARRAWKSLANAYTENTGGRRREGGRGRVFPVRSRARERVGKSRNIFRARCRACRGSLARLEFSELRARTGT